MSDKPNKTVHITNIPLVGEGEDGGQRALSVRVLFDYGGICYATYNRKAKGFYVSVTPVEIGGGMVRFGMFTGRGAFIEPAAKYNGKRHARLCAEFGNDTSPPAMLVDLIRNLLAENGTEISDDAPGWKHSCTPVAASV